LVEGFVIDPAGVRDHGDLISGGSGCRGGRGGRRRTCGTGRGRGGRRSGRSSLTAADERKDERSEQNKR